MIRSTSAASSRPLNQLNGKIEAELQRQISQLIVPVPTLRQHPADIPAIAESLLGGQDVGRIRHYPGAKAQEALFDGTGEREQRQAALAWAQEQGIRYALAGTAPTSTVSVVLPAPPFWVEKAR